jgi:hypothetical protein
MLTRDGMRWFTNHYLKSPSEAQDWRVSPLRAASLAGLPPEAGIGARGPAAGFREGGVARMPIDADQLRYVYDKLWAHFVDGHLLGRPAQILALGLFMMTVECAFVKWEETALYRLTVRRSVSKVGPWWT